MQALSILLSCLLYGHYLSASAIIGVIIVFFAIFLRIYYGHREKKKKDAATINDLNKPWYFSYTRSWLTSELERGMYSVFANRLETVQKLLCLTFST